MKEEVGLVERGLMILMMVILEVVLAASVLGTHPFNLNFMLDRAVMVQVAINVDADLNELRAALAELTNSLGNVTIM